jgi:EmrB/QacA subfamily drug resistance transporter
MLSMIDTAVVNVAVPSIARELQSSLSTVQWTVSSYLLALAAGQAGTAWIARRFGILRAYTASIVLFTMASMACALAPNMGILILGRIAQGLGGAPLVPLALGLLLGRDGERQRIPASAGLMLFAAPALGPALGGLLVSGFGWRSIFLINPIIGLIALLGVTAARRRGMGTPGDTHAALDGVGVVILAAGLALATYGASQGAEQGWLSVASLPWWAVGLLLLIIYGRWTTHLSIGPGPSPAVNLALLRSGKRILALSLVAITSSVLYSVLFIAPVFLQEVQHHSAGIAGLALLPQGVVMGLASALGNRIVERGKERPGLVAASIVAGMGLLALFTLGLVLLQATTALWLTAALLCGRGIAIGLTTQPLTLMLLGNLDPAEQADANTLFSATQRLAGSFGVALFTAYFTHRAQATGSPILALHDSALVMSAVAVVGAVGGLWLPGLSHHRSAE